MKTDIIVLASGFSRRFQGNKLLYRIDGIPLIEHTLLKLTKLPANGIYVVTQYPEIINLANHYNMTPIMNFEAMTGQASSIRIGLSHSNSDQVLLIVADQPYIRQETLEAYRIGFSGRFDELYKALRKQGFEDKEILESQDILTVECREEELKDIDTRDDINKGTAD